MTDLMNTLYEYVLTQSKTYLAAHPEYEDFCLRAAEQEATFRATLTLCRGLNRTILA